MSIGNEKGKEILKMKLHKQFKRMIKAREEEESNQDWSVRS